MYFLADILCYWLKIDLELLASTVVATAAAKVGTQKTKNPTTTLTIQQRPKFQGFI